MSHFIDSLKMKLYLTLVTLLLLSCQNSRQEKVGTPVQQKEPLSVKATDNNLKSEDSIYRCESTKFTSVLEELPNQDSNAYSITITSKDSKNKITKILDIRPGFSQINYCNDLYTVVGFPCGGPCYSQVFIFTDENRSVEQYDYAQTIRNHPNLIGHIRNEEFEKLILHNFLNSKELTIDLSNSNPWNYGYMDSMLVKKDNLLLYYQSKKEKPTVKKIKLKAIL